MTDDQKHTDYMPVQHPLISRSALPEAIIQFLILVIIVAVLYWAGAGFEITLFALLISGFSLNTLNIMGISVGQNIYLAEIRNELRKHADRTESQPPPNSN